MRVRSTAALFGAAVLAVPSIARAQARAVPTPASVIDFAPGTDRKLPSWKQVTDYFSALDAASSVPARVIGEHAGGLVAGSPADITVVDDNLAVERVLIGGREHVVV